MRQIVLFVSVLVLFLVCIVNGAEPNFVRSTIKNVDGATPPHDVISTDYTDGLGRALQSKLQINSGSMSGRARVVSSFFDNAGRPYLTTKPYIDLTTNSKDLFTPGDFNAINAILDNSDNYSAIKGTDPSAYAYSESQYYDDPLGRVKRAGAPGIDYRLGSDHFTSSWTFGVTTDYVASPTPYSFNIIIVRADVTSSVNVDVTVNGGFIRKVDKKTSDATNSEILDGFYNYLVTSPIANSDHFLTVTRDPDDSLTQEIKDLFGKTDSTRSLNGTQEIIAKYKYDILGNLLTEEAPKGTGGSTLISDSRYEYNTLGQLVKKINPDLFIEDMTYDNAGNIESKIVHGMNATFDMFTITYKYDYDDLSRLKRIRTPHVNNSGSAALVKYFYDNTDEFFTEAKSYGIPTENFTNLENTQGKLVAEIAYNRPAGRRFYFGGFKPELVVDVYSYDDEGRIKTKYKVIPGLSLQTMDYTYDNHGKMKTEEFKCGYTTSMKFYKYDADGNLKAIAHNDESNDVVAYLNDPHGWLKSKDFSKLTGGKTLSYTYNIRDWMTESNFNGSNNFTQQINYNYNPTNVTDKTFSGNIRFSEIGYNSSSGIQKVFRQSYDYDKVNRLSTFSTTDELFTPVSKFSGSFDYDNAGRFTKKEEGTSKNSNYEYYPDVSIYPTITQKTSRLRHAKTGGGIYIYDYKGNMIIDQSKNMYISYDWRNLPIKFDFYNTLPVGPTNSSKISPDPYGTMIITDNSYHSTDPTNYVDYIDWLRANGAITLLSSVQMYYDAAGKRVLKVEGK